MEQFYLESPSLIRKNDAMDYLNEHVETNSDINGTGGLDRTLKYWTYEEWLENLEKRKDTSYAYSINRVPSLTYFLVRVNDNKIVGMINIRFNLTKEYLEFGGHIGYGIRPSERGKGYNKINLYLGLIKSKEIGLNKVMLDCTTINLPSKKTIVDLGGIKTKEGIDPYDNTMTSVYWINTDESIERYKSIYDEYLYKKIK